MATLAETISAHARDVAPDAVRMRRDLHRHPEVAWTERRTTYRIAEALSSYGLDPVVRADLVGLTVEIGSGSPIVGFRADIDALPIHEETGAPYRSQIDGVMHACGHDAHAAIAVGIARTLAKLGDLPGIARIIFQPAEEELPSGAARLIEEGTIDDLAALIAFHVDPTIPPGVVGLKPGPITSAADKLHIRLTGPGGHTSRPHRTVDLVQVAARIVVDLPAMVRAELDPRQHLAMVFGRISGGDTANAIPTHVDISGTARVQENEVWEGLAEIIDRQVEAIAAPFGAGIEVSHLRGAPPVDNDAAVIGTIESAAAAVLGPEGVRPTPQSMGSEDFAWFLDHVPGALIRLGAGKNEHPVDLHSPTFEIDETAIEHGIAVGAISLLHLMERSR
jgi:amidohydrolase